MNLKDMTGAQRRQMIDAKQVYEAWRSADREFRHRYRGSMHWRKVAGREYLSRKHGNRWEQIGPRSAETENIKEEYVNQRSILRSRIRKFDKKLAEMAPLNRAMGIARVPDIASRVLRKLDQRDMLGSHVFVAGTHSLYAYEAASGVLFDSDLTTTSDIDFLWDARQRFTFLMQDINEHGLIGLLQQVDPTFKRTHTFRAQNEQPYLVEFIRPFSRNEVGTPDLKISDAEGDITPAALEGLQWLLNAPKLEDIAISEDGRPVLISCIDPRAYAVHKLWLSTRPTREGIKRRRDEMQAHAVASVAINHLGLQFDRSSLSAMSKEVADGAKELVNAAKKQSIDR